MICALIVDLLFVILGMPALRHPSTHGTNANSIGISNGLFVGTKKGSKQQAAYKRCQSSSRNIVLSSKYTYSITQYNLSIYIYTGFEWGIRVSSTAELAK